jgi:alpha-glucosidase
MKPRRKENYAHLNHTLGKILNLSVNETGLDIEAENAEVRVIVYSPQVIRIRIFKKEDDERDFSYSVITQPQANEFKVVEEKDEILVVTLAMTLKISRKPIRFAFYTPDDKLINTDEPAFGTSWIRNEVATYKTLQPGEKFIGLGEKTGGLNRRGNAYTNWNTDYFAYPSNGDPLYVSLPFYIGIHSNLAYGIFFDNTHKTQFNFGASNHRFAYFKAEDGEMNYYFIYDDNVAGIIKHYSTLTGTMPLPPIWSLGYQQCRYSYYPEQEVLSLADNFRKRDIPADVIYLDIHYMDKYKVFTWNNERFPEPTEMIRKLREQGFHVVVMVDPGVKIEAGDETYESGLKNDVFVKYPDGEPFSAQVWPGWCHFPDFTKPKVREWWGKLYEYYTEQGLDGFWNDMNEPACWGQTIPDLIEFNYEGHLATHKKGRNVYGMQMARASFEGTKKLLKGKRPFLLTRSGFSGIQRYAAVWTGDNVASDEHMLTGIRLVTSMGLTGVAFSGYDIGGFVGESSPELYARWLSIAAFAPFFRGHTMINSRDSEPWSYGEEVEEISRNFIKFRYKIKPYLYAAFYEATQTGMPIARSLAIDYTFDDKIYEGNYQNEYLFGSSLLVCPVESWQKISKVYLPKGGWYNLYSGQYYKGEQELYIDTPKEKLPVFVKAGAIIPAQQATNSMTDKTETTLEIHLYAGEEDSSFIYYEDDGETYEHETGGFYKRKIKYKAGKNRLKFTQKEGAFISSYDKVKLYFHGFKKIGGVQIGKERYKTEKIDFSFFTAISAFDPFYDINDCYGRYVVETAEFPLEDIEFSVEW